MPTRSNHSVDGSMGDAAAEKDAAVPPGVFLECSVESYQKLLPQLKSALEKARAAYGKIHPQAPPWQVSSAWRSLRRQAELMAEMSRRQLEDMYCAHGYPQYVQAIVAAGMPEADEVYEILRHRSEGYISRHLFGAAVDIVASSVEDVPLLKELLAQSNVTVLDERDMGVECLHLSIATPTPPPIIRE